MSTIAERLAAAPISWGVCEVPGWGWQHDPATVLAQMQEVGLAATELGPDGFLPDDPLVKAKVLAEHGLRAVGGFVPVVLHDRQVDPVSEVAQVLADLAVVGARTLVLAAATGTPGYDVRQGRDTDRQVPGGLDDDGWQVLLRNLDRLALLADGMGITATVHPHVGTLVETADDVERVLAGSGIGLCLDTGHLFIGGADPVAIAAEHAGRIRHTHLKDVDAPLAAAVRTGEVTYTEAVRRGLYRPLGQGDLDIASILHSLEHAGYDGWYVLEQDTILTEPAEGLPDGPPDGLADGPPEGLAAAHHGPMADVRASIENLLATARAIS